jgi:hypothetical protein
VSEEAKAGALVHDKDGKFVKGHPPMGGRPKGSKNRITLAKLALEESLRDALGPEMAKVASLVVQQAKDGDKASQKLVWDAIMSKQTVSDEKNAGTKQEIRVRTMNVNRGDVIEGEIIDDSTNEETHNEQ